MSSENDNNTKATKPLKLQLTKTVTAGQVQQNVGHGKRMVTVEIRKTRTIARPDASGQVPVTRPANEASVQKSPEKLSDNEKSVRIEALKKAEVDRHHSQPKRNQEQPVTPDGAEVTETKPQRKFEVSQHKEKPTKNNVKSDEKLVLSRKEEENKTIFDSKEFRSKKGGESKRRSRKLTIQQLLEEEERTRSMASIRRAREKAKRQEDNDKVVRETEKFVREVVVPEAIEVQELANRMAVRGADVVKALMKLGLMATINQKIDADTAELIISEFGHTIKRVTESDVENVLKEEKENPELLKPRPPIVTIMGHVDHGKTTLLDTIRQTDVAKHEAGGITQHIGAYQITVKNGQKITFIDTPGHEAFTAMRARGAKVTDIVILVVAADDSIMPQTIEAINHAKAAKVPIIVAINKIDKPDANPARVKQDLLSHDLVPEDLGGDVIVVEVSAQKKIGIDNLLEAILVQAEVLALKANPDRNATGTIIEAKVDRGRGVVATVIVQKGTIKNGNIIVAGGSSGRIRSLINDSGKAIDEAGPSMPVEIIGLDEVPEAGQDFVVVEDERTAREISQFRQDKQRKIRTTATKTLSVEQMFQSASDQGEKILPVVIKADVHGSAEALSNSLGKLHGDNVAVKVVHSAVGGIIESDISLALATGATIIAFNVRANQQAKDLAARDGVDIRYYSIIYDAVDDIKIILSGMMAPTMREEFLGYAEVRQVFEISKVGKIAGCYVTEGMVARNAGCRLLRDNVVIYTGKLKTLKRFKDEVKEVKSGFECGIAFEGYDDIREGDRIEAFKVIEEKKTL